VFTYSPRPGTPAAKQTGQVPTVVARERNAVLRQIASAKKRAFLNSLVGTEVEAITLQAGGADFTEALTENYLKVKIPGRLEANRWLRLGAERVEGEMLVARPQKSMVDVEEPSALLVTGELTKENNPIDPQPLARLG